MPVFPYKTQSFSRLLSFRCSTFINPSVACTVRNLHLLFAREKNRHNATRLLFQNVPSFLYHFSPRPFFSKFIRRSFLNQSKLFQKTRKPILVLILKKRKTSFSRTTEKLYEFPYTSSMLLFRRLYICKFQYKESALLFNNWILSSTDISNSSKICTSPRTKRKKESFLIINSEDPHTSYIIATYQYYQ